MTKDEFVALCTEEGLTRREAELFWKGKPSALEKIPPRPELIRETARHFLPIIKRLRRRAEARRN